MVSSMRHWATVRRASLRTRGTRSVSSRLLLDSSLFDTDGLDPYMEDPATSWLVHWHLCGHSDTRLPGFGPSATIRPCPSSVKPWSKVLASSPEERSWDRASKATIRRDVTCFVRTYVAQRSSRQTGQEDALESPLTELGLIKQVGKSERFRFVQWAEAVSRCRCVLLCGNGLLGSIFRNRPDAIL